MIQNSPQNQAGQQQEDSMRSSQQGINRLGTDGKPVTPRLAEEQRPMSPSIGGAAGGAAQQAAKFALSKYLPYILIGGSIAAGGAVTYVTYLST